MEIVSKKRALDKIYKRRDRYEIPDWQREEVWNTAKKQELIDSILRGWKLPKFYFLRLDKEAEEFEVVDGQQRLVAIFGFFANQLPLRPETEKEFGGKYYQDLPHAISDAFDDFEIEYDEIFEADDAELKEFFQRLQQGLPLTSSEKLNAVHSNLRDFCRELANHKFFTKVAFANKRYAYFDIAAKVAAVEIEGIDVGLRFEDLQAIFEAQKSFSSASAVAKRLQATLDYMNRVFSKKDPQLRNRSIVQSILTLGSRIVNTGRSAGLEKQFHKFINGFLSELSRQVELGNDATDRDYLLFQDSVNANIRAGARTRSDILLRKLIQSDPQFATIFDPTIVAESGLSKDVKRLGDAVAGLVTQVNTAYSAKHGIDLFKPTTKTMASLLQLDRRISNYAEYKDFISNLYFLFWEGVGTRLDPTKPTSFKEINELRTDLEHDLDHGKAKEAAAKRKKVNQTFVKYSGGATPSTISPNLFPVFQANLLTAIEGDLRIILGKL